jgi:methylenetetrahydrofolate dehydrogenase (NADP+) / methenyltetrahydrofolate cyclohydrolase
MTAQILDGKRLSTRILQGLSDQIRQLLSEGRRAPGLAVILVGDDAASQIYVRKKQEACTEVGIVSTLYPLNANTTQADLSALIQRLNGDDQIDGILLQLPLPASIDTTALIDHINPAKDVDGFHPYNLGCLAARRPRLHPCTPLGVMTLLAETGVSLRGLNAVVVGASNVVGRPMALELLHAEATVTIAHRFTKNLEQHVRTAELLVVAIGKPQVIQSDWIQPGAIVIDVGINRLDDGSVVGDIDFATAKERAAWITPVPGGVGPMTVATLLQNTLEAYLTEYRRLYTPRGI